MELVQHFFTNHVCYKQGKALKVKGLMLHSIGSAQPSASGFLKNWNTGTYTRACVHGFIDANQGVIYQTLPWNMRGWHGGGSSNDTHIGVEMCETKGVKYVDGKISSIVDYDLAVKDVTTTYNCAVELYAMLCEQFNLDPLKKGVIVSHSEGHSLGIASNHGDPEHIWKFLKLPFTMDTFRNDVAMKMGNVIVEEKEYVEEPKTEERKLDIAKYKDSSLSGTYTTIDELNIRRGAVVKDGNILAVIPNGKKCKCFGYYNLNGKTKWYLIQHEGVTGYVNSNYLRRV